MKLRNRKDIPKGFELKDNSTPSFSFVENYDGIEIKRKIKGWNHLFQRGNNGPRLHDPQHAQSIGNSKSP